jgi:hypothetical protein
MPGKLPRVLVAFVLASGLTAGLVSLMGCGQPPAPVTRTHTPPAATPDAIYKTRAQIVTLPQVNVPQSEFRAKHEAVDDFKDKDGKIVGMGAMVMDFPPAKGVDLSQFKVGDFVLIEWHVWWNHTPAWLAMNVTKLPNDTQLTFRKANPPAPAPTPAPAAPAPAEPK